MGAQKSRMSAQGLCTTRQDLRTAVPEACHFSLEPHGRAYFDTFFFWIRMTMPKRCMAVRKVLNFDTNPPHGRV